MKRKTDLFAQFTYSLSVQYFQTCQWLSKELEIELPVTDLLGFGLWPHLSQGTQL